MPLGAVVRPRGRGGRGHATAGNLGKDVGLGTETLEGNGLGRSRCTSACPWQERIQGAHQEAFQKPARAESGQGICFQFEDCGTQSSESERWLGFIGYVETADTRWATSIQYCE